MPPAEPTSNMDALRIVSHPEPTESANPANGAEYSSTPTETLLLEKPPLKLLGFKPRHAFKWTLLALLIAAVIVIWGVTPPSGFPSKSPFFVHKGDSVKRASLNLKEGGYVRSSWLFYAYARTIATEKGVIAGTYVFEKPLTIFGIAHKLMQQSGGATNIKVTIPEGSSNEQIAEILSKNISDFNTQEFLLKATTSHGYLFPDTYFISQYSTTDQVLEAFSNNFKKKIAEVDDQIKKSGKSLDEILTMAALVEEEGNTDESRKIIADILWRRLKEGMPLQVDVATSTYQSRGLTDKPISNPGLAAIVAVLNPTPNKYVYYLSDNDGVFHYAVTFDEHKANVAKYLK